MRERGDGLRLALEARAAIRIVGERRRQDLDGDVAVEPRIAGAIDLAHAARADGAEHLVRSKTGYRDSVASFSTRDRGTSRVWMAVCLR